MRPQLTGRCPEELEGGGRAGSRENLHDAPEALLRFVQFSQGGESGGELDLTVNELGIHRRPLSLERSQDRPFEGPGRLVFSLFFQEAHEIDAGFANAGGGLLLE